MEDVISLILISIFIPLVFQLFMFFQMREERKYKHQAVNRTKAPKWAIWLFLGFAILFFSIMIIAASLMIVNGESTSSIVIVICVMGLFVALGLFGFSYMRFRYEIFDDEKVTVIRCFSKPKTYYYKDIAYYSYMPGIIGGLRAYDKNGITLFSQESIYVGMEDLKNTIANHNIAGVPFDYFVKHMQGNSVFKAYRKKFMCTVIAWAMFGIGLMFVGLFGMVLPNADYEVYRNYPVQGIVKSYEFGQSDTFSLKLAGDENKYYINNIVYKKLDGALERKINAGDEVSLHIGYKDSRGRLNISQLQIGDNIYLRMEEAEQAERDNDDGIVVCAYVFLGIGGALMAAWLGFFVYAKVTLKKRLDDELQKAEAGT
ncbi:MAG: hypothetical protein K2O39_05140 [Clostridiales bacterium]|nr:hypothetical protein [Clostridiales bacterium]